MPNLNYSLDGVILGHIAKILNSWFLQQVNNQSLTLPISITHNSTVEIKTHTLQISISIFQNLKEYFARPKSFRNLSFQKKN